MMFRLAAVLLALSLLRAIPAAAFVQYQTDGGWLFAGSLNDEFNGVQQRTVPPAVVTSGGDFSFHGALCPASGTPNFLCANLEARADVVGNQFSLHSRARLVRQNAFGAGGTQLVYADTVIDMRGRGSAVFPTSGFVVFRFGMEGTFVSTTNSAMVTLETATKATLFAGASFALQCAGGECTPINLHMTTDPSNVTEWHPTDEIELNLRTDARIVSPLGVDGWDAQSISDFGDTMTLLAIEVQDENHVPIPDAHIEIPDATGPGTVLVIPNQPAPTTTTVPTTTTTTTLPGSGELCGNCTDDDHDGLIDAEQPACCEGSPFAVTITSARVTPKGAVSRLALRGSVAVTDVARLRGDVSLVLRSETAGPLLCIELPASLFRSKGRTVAFRLPKGGSVPAGGIDHLVMRVPRHGASARIDLGGKHAAFTAPGGGALRVTLGIDGAGGASCGGQTVQLRANKRGALRFP